jgi:hypothetical protein
MAVDYAHTDDAVARRAKKAGDLAASLIERHITWHRAKGWSRNERCVAELMAGIPPCSDETWDAVLSIVKGVRNR